MPINETCISWDKEHAEINCRESVRLGEYDTLTENDCVEEVDDTITCNNGSVSIPIQEFVVHNAFKRGQYPKNDIALLRLARLVTFNGKNTKVFDKVIKEISTLTAFL